MGQIIAFTEDSATIAVESLQMPSKIPTSQDCIAAWAVNRQMKAGMKPIYEELLGDVLDGLEHEFNEKDRTDRTSWARSFCLITILCMIVEELQIVCDGMVLNNISRENEDAIGAAKSGVTCCQELEEVLVKYCWSIFSHMDRQYNPIKNGCPKDEGWGQNTGVAELFEEICQVIYNFGNYRPFNSFT
jgi:hypothetical protein